MNFLQKIFGKTKQISEPVPIIEKVENNQNPEEIKESYLTLVRLLSQDNNRAAQGMVYALEDSTKFLEQYKAMFAEWYSIETTVEEVESYPTWDLFNYVLYDEGYVTLNDWKSAAEDFVYFLEQIVEKYGETLDHSKITNQEEMAPEFFEQLKAALPQGLALLNIDIDSDSYQLTVVPVDKVNAVKDAAAVVGGKIEWY